MFLGKDDVSACEFFRGIFMLPKIVDYSVLMGRWKDEVDNSP